MTQRGRFDAKGSFKNASRQQVPEIKGGLRLISTEKGNPKLTRRCNCIGASECLERERGPGGPPSDQRERVYEVN